MHILFLQLHKDQIELMKFKEGTTFKKMNTSRRCISRLAPITQRYYNATIKQLDMNERIIPSVSETDNGTFGFKNSSWRSNKNWRPFSTNSLPNASTSRGLFGNMILDVQECRNNNLNKIMYDTTGSQHRMMHEM
jgi:hypothetical protein